MSATACPVENIDGAVYRILREDEPLSVPELLSILEDDPGYGIELATSIDHQKLQAALKKLVKKGHVTHDAGVDSEGNVKWRTTDRPDLNPKPDGSEVSTETILDAD